MESFVQCTVDEIAGNNRNWQKNLNNKDNFRENLSTRPEWDFLFITIASNSKQSGGKILIIAVTIEHFA